MGKYTPQESPSSSANMLYGRSRGKPKLAQKRKHKKETLPAPGVSSSSESLANVPDLLERLELKTAVTPIDKRSNETLQPFTMGASGNVQSILRLIGEVSQIFKEVPYIKAVATIVGQIITIFDEIQANEDMIQELLDKIMRYSKVVFEDVLSHQDRDMSCLKDHFIEMKSVLGDIYNLSQEIKASRLKRSIYRADIANKIAKHGRKVDDDRQNFQTKLSLEIYKTRQNPIQVDVSLDSIAVHHRIRNPRSKPQIMFGRQKEINTLVNAVLESDLAGLPTRIPILGSGGIGKTTLALSVLHDDNICARFGAERVFVNCEAASTEDLLVRELAGSLELSTENINLFQHVLRRLENHPILLVLDNFETPWDPPHTRSEIESLLATITSIKTLVCIITMRGSQKPSGTQWSNVLPPLQPVDLPSAIAIFKAISFKEDKYAIKLVQAVDCLPLAVTLMAHLASVDGETTEALWSRWQKESTSMVEGGQDRLSSLVVSVQTSLASPRMQRDPSAEAFLRLLSLLPDGMSPNTLHVCEAELSDMLSVKKALSTLRQNALVYEDSTGTLRVLSPIRLFMCAHRPPSPESRQILYNHFIQLALQGPSYHDSNIRLQLERDVGNITAILLDALKDLSPTSLEEVIGAVINFCHYTYISGINSSETLVAMAVNRLQLLQHSGSTIPPLQPEKISWRDRFPPLTKRQSKVTSSSNGLFSDIDLLSKLQADCLGCWGQILSRQSRFELAREKFNLAKDLHIKAGDIGGQASDILNIALLLSRDPKNFDKASLAFQDAIQLHEMSNDILGKAHDLLGAGHLLRANFRFAEAQDMFDNVAALFADMKYNSGRFLALNGIGTVMQDCSRFSEAERYFTEAVQLSTEIGDVVSQAEGLTGLAVSFLLMSRFAEAQNTIEKAIRLRQPFLEGEHLYILARVLMARVQFKKAKEFLLLARSLHEDSGDKLGLWYDFYHLAQIAFYQGKTRVAERIVKKGLCLPPTLLQEAHLHTFNAIIFVRCGDSKQALPLLTQADNIYSDVSSKIDQATCSLYRGIIHLRNTKFRSAMKDFTRALEIHTEIGNVQGQADDMNKISQTLLVQGHPQEALAKISKALALHAQIEDLSGQGDDLYILATIYLAQKKLVDAEQAIRQALELHKRSESKYNQARDLARLSEIIWQMRIGGCEVEEGTLEDSVDALAILRQAIDLFKSVCALSDAHEYGKLERSMTGENPEMVVPVSLSCI